MTLRMCWPPLVQHTIQLRGHAQTLQHRDRGWLSPLVSLLQNCFIDDVRFCLQSVRPITADHQSDQLTGFFSREPLQTARQEREDPTTQREARRSSPPKGERTNRQPDTQWRRDSHHNATVVSCCFQSRLIFFEMIGQHHQRLHKDYALRQPFLHLVAERPILLLLVVVLPFLPLVLRTSGGGPSFLLWWCLLWLHLVAVVVLPPPIVEIPRKVWMFAPQDSAELNTVLQHAETE